MRGLLVYSQLMSDRCRILGSEQPRSPCSAMLPGGISIPGEMSEQVSIYKI